MGNIQDLDPHIPNKLGEWNIFADTAAAKDVIASGVPLTMVPLDVTKHIQVTEQFYNELSDLAERNGKTAVSLAYNLIKALKIAFEKEHPEINFFDVYYLWDPFAAMVALEPQIAKIEEKYIKVDLQTGKTEEVSGSGEGIGHVRVAMDIAKPAPEILHHLLEAIASLTPPDMKHEAVTVPPFTLFGSNKGGTPELANRDFKPGI
ncbi:nucleoside hydrolase [Legionella jordanis]|nr:nucleoside hydrolase [Legionella jordanis]RMX22050.1 nucleoside hydrolase [Legionella jordanis]